MTDRNKIAIMEAGRRRRAAHLPQTGGFMQILVKGGYVLDPASGREDTLDIRISGGRIARIGKRIPASGATVIDARGMLVVPGLVDIHCHLREPGREDEETILSGSLSAASGGFTTVCCMGNTEPALDNRVPIRFVLDQARNASCEILPIGCVTVNREGRAIAPFGEMAEAGAVAFSDDGNCLMDSLVMRRALEYTKLFGRPVVSHAEDACLVRNGVMNEGDVSTRMGLPGIPRAAEIIMVARDIALADLTGGRLHLAHLTTAQSVDMVRQARRSSRGITCEAAVHHLVLTEESVAGYDTNAKVSPPLRTARDIEALVSGLKDGTIDCVVTDHAPHSQEEKDSGFDQAPFGMIGFETALPLVLSLCRKGGLSLRRAVGVLTSGPAKVFGLDRGVLREGGRGDVAVVDPDREWVLTRETIRSRSRNSPFIGRTLRGKVMATIAGGTVVFREEA